MPPTDPSSSSAVTGLAVRREIRLSLVAMVLHCVSLWLVARDHQGHLSVSKWDRDGRLVLRGRGVDEDVLTRLAALPVLRPALDPAGAIVLTVRSRDGAVVGWRLVGSLGYDFLDLEVTARMAPVLADPVLLEHAAPHPPPGPVQPAKLAASLTTREAQILTLVGEGLKARSIARRCGISERTVQKHLEQVYRKLECHDRLSALLLARDAGLLAAEAPVLAS